MFPVVETPVKAYVIVLLWLWAASIGLPIPEDIALLTGGFWCYQSNSDYSGFPDVLIMIGVALFGVLSGDLFIFFLGHRWAASLLDHRMTRRMATPERMAALRRQFLRHQLKTVFVGRFLPGMRTLVFLTAGAMKMRLWKFLLVNGGAALVSVPLFVGLGYLFGHSFETVKKSVKHYEHIAVIVALVGLCLWLLWHSYARSARDREARALLADENREREKSTPVNQP
jgi:membrane protein DedA with SNARE-associated domain